MKTVHLHLEEELYTKLVALKKNHDRIVIVLPETIKNRTWDGLMDSISKGKGR